jgi:hypothetical protein
LLAAWFSKDHTFSLWSEFQILLFSSPFCQEKTVEERRPLGAADFAANEGLSQVK